MSDEVLIQLRHFLETHTVFKNIADCDFKPCPPCDENTITEAELKLGFQLPKLLREIYTTVANGGFGPGYGVMGVPGGFTDDANNSIVDAYNLYSVDIPDEPTWKWPKGWIPFCHWGCIIYSVIDCIHHPNPICFVCIGDKQEDATMDSIVILHKPSLEQWLNDWMDGKNLWDEAFHS